MTEPTEQHPAIQSLFLEDEMFLPNAYYSVPNPLGFTTSKETTLLAHDNVVDSEKMEAAAVGVDDSPKVEVYSVAKISPKCDRYPFKTAELKRTQRPPVDQHCQRWGGPQ